MKTKVFGLLIGVLLIGSFIVGCGGGGSKSPTATATPTPTAVATATPTATPSGLLSDSFTASTLDATIWSNFAGGNSSVTIAADPTNSANNAAKLIGSGNSMYIWSVAGAAWTDYAYETKVYLDAASSAAFELCIRSSNSTNTCYGVQFFSGGTAYFFKRVNSARSYLGGTTAANTGLATSSVTGTWKKLKLVASGSSSVTLQLYVDDVLQATSTADTDNPITSGSVGAVAFNGATLYLDNVSVK